MRHFMPVFTFMALSVSFVYVPPVLFPAWASVWCTIFFAFLAGVGAGRWLWEDP